VAWELGSFLGQGSPLLAVQQLLIKGLFKPETEIATVEACACALMRMHAAAFSCCLLGMLELLVDSCTRCCP
jgi:hypothetical protein